MGIPKDAAYRKYRRSDVLMISSSKNPRIQEIRHLHTPKGRRSQGLFLVEGTHLLQESLTAQWPLHSLYFTPDWDVAHPGFRQRLPPTLPTYVVSEGVLQALSTTTTPDGIVAVAHRPSSLDPPPWFRLGLALETLQDPGNVGTILRTAVAAGAEGLWLTPDSVDPDHPKLLRASAGQWFHLPPRVLGDPEAFFTTCRQRGIQILATASQGSRSYWEVDLRPPSLILLGNEGAGLSPQWLDYADLRVSIPMHPQVESLNVGISAGLILYEVYRQRQTCKTPQEP